MDFSRFDNTHGDEDELAQEYRDIQEEIYWLGADEE